MTVAVSPQRQAERFELLRVLAAVADSPAGAAGSCRALGLADPGPAGHTEAFVLNCPPYAAVYLGEHGALGGEAADRVAGFWRALAVTPPAEPDHLTTLVSLYTSLGDAAREAERPATTGALTRARYALFHEHLWPWLPGYLDAVADLAIPALAGWAELTGQALAAEHAALAAEAADMPGPPATPLPLALRSAPPPAGAAAGAGLDDLLDMLIAPVRSGFILTRRRLAVAADAAGAGYRIGERRFALRALLEQAPAATLTWLAEEAERWQCRHAARAAARATTAGATAGDPAHAWWAERAGHTTRLLAEAAGAAGATGAAVRSA